MCADYIDSTLHIYTVQIIHATFILVPPTTPVTPGLRYKIPVFSDPATYIYIYIEREREI